jgi:hypothetical protein
MSVMKIFRNKDAAGIVSSEEKVLQLSNESPLGRRNPVLDLMKGLLIALMVISHVHDGLNLSIPWLDPRRGVLQLTIFSGFIFAFGYGTYKAYLAKPVLPRRRMIINILRILGAYYICAIAYGFFYDHSLSLSSILLALRLKSLVIFTEFLLPYTIILILILFVPRLFLIVTQKNAIFWPVIAGLLVTTFFNYSQIHSVLLSLIIGSNTIISYPVVQYMPLYLMGIYFAQRQIRFSWKFLGGAILAIAIFIIAHINGWDIRFPPSIFWIVGSMGAVYVSFLLAHLLYYVKFLAVPLIDMGKRTLFWLLMSNLLIFATAQEFRLISLPWYWNAGIEIGCLLVIGYISTLRRK